MLSLSTCSGPTIMAKHTLWKVSANTLKNVIQPTYMEISNNLIDKNRQIIEFSGILGVKGPKNQVQFEVGPNY